MELLPKETNQYRGSSYLDPSWGFAMGWNYTLGAGITVCAEVAAAILLIEYWNDSVRIPKDI